jgi:hypothetical protein
VHYGRAILHRGGESVSVPDIGLSELEAGVIPEWRKRLIAKQK